MMGSGPAAERRRKQWCLGVALSVSAGLLTTAVNASGQSDSTRIILLVTVRGSVVDAVSGQPIGHALVRLGQRAMLTDSDGHFSFQRVDSAQLNVSAMKPGYSFTRGPGDPSEIAIDTTAAGDPVVLRLYPEALLLGSVEDDDAVPLRDVAVTAFRSSIADDGRHWTNAASAHTNARGQFRLGVPAGDYRVESEYLKLTQRTALLPAGAPASQAGQVLKVHSGEQVNVDLRPATASLVEVLARVDGTSIKNFSQLNALAESGRRFPVTFSPSGGSDLQMSLPIGTYALEAKHRNGFGDESEVANISVTQPDRTPLGVALHFAPVSPIQVNVQMDDASIEAASGGLQNQPTVSVLGLTLEPVDGTASTDSEPIRPVQRIINEGTAASVSFAAAAGTYRLRAHPGGPWYVVAATAGGTDLLSHELLVAAAAANLPIEVVVSNQTASVTGKVSVAGKPGQGWVYLIASYPTASPLYPLRSGVDGTYSSARLPPGSYHAIAFSRRYSLDAYDPDALAAYSTHEMQLTVQAGEKTKLDLEAVTEAEMKP